MAQVGCKDGFEVDLGTILLKNGGMDDTPAKCREKIHSPPHN
jgi:hypothetical protein